MLQLRPNCEWCDKDLPPDSRGALMCTYECTFCVDCNDTILHNVCPNCGGELVRRPIRPTNAHRPPSKTGLFNNPPSQDRKYSRWTRAQVDELTEKLRYVPSEER